jgi:AcrR family transcriptional regulator
VPRHAGQSVSTITEVSRPLRADAERNRRRLLDVAAAVFAERGLDVGVAEIAERARIGRGTLFRNFPTKRDLVAAIVSDRMHSISERGRELLEADDPGAALFDFLEEMRGRRQLDRALVEALADTFLANAEIRAAYTDVLCVLDALLAPAQAAGAVRGDVGAVDVLMLVKGIAETATAFPHAVERVAERQMDLVRAALSPAAAAQPLCGPVPTLSDIEPVPDAA